MKNSVIILLLIATVMSSCNNTEKQEEHESTKEVVLAQEADILSTAWMDDIKLNDGSKWKANIETTEGVVKMQGLLNTQSTVTIEDYHELASKLNEVKNWLVKECTMKGPSHDNLHIWLYPLIEKIVALSEANTLAEASEIKQSIVDNINSYTNYFQ
ncbi:MAG: hypothetical protein WBM53_02755 [Maribacter sp.]